jgi:hypothetical protein
MGSEDRANLPRAHGWRQIVDTVFLDFWESGEHPLPCIGPLKAKV